MYTEKIANLETQLATVTVAGETSRKEAERLLKEDAQLLQRLSSSERDNKGPGHPRRSERRPAMTESNVHGMKGRCSYLESQATRRCTSCRRYAGRAFGRARRDSLARPSLSKHLIQHISQPYSGSMRRPSFILLPTHLGVFRHLANALLTPK